MESHERYGRKETSWPLWWRAVWPREPELFARTHQERRRGNQAQARGVPKPGTQSAAAQNAEGGKRDKSVPDAELERRLKALQAAKAREAEDEERRAEEEKEREEERARRRAEAEAKEREEREREEALKAKEEEDARRKAEEETRATRRPRPSRRPPHLPRTSPCAARPSRTARARAAQGRGRP
jgi:translation initiation factor IF-2